MPSDQLASSKQTSTHSTYDLNLVSKLFEASNGALGDTFFQVYCLVEHIASLWHTGTDTHARRIERSLRREVEDELVEQDLDMALGLHETTHDTVDAV